MDAFLISTGIVALAEIGDKTQLLAFMLAAKFRKPAPIIFGILVATLLNHGMAGALGTWIPHLLDAAILRWVLGIGFIVMAIWILIPDKLDEGDAKFVSLGVFGTTVVAFFLAEMGDKTQIATVALAAQYQSFTAVVLGTTVGMLLANAPAVLLGNKFANSLPISWIHRVVAAIFAIMGLVVLLGLDSNLGL
ncbi:putative Ca2+/H+ antiporter (TMEM165/GDT1 family) [Paraperlucidibaca baekdonensis]|uniref:GDT1 family protein n=1 Tax=Paraperlucidibaca baekdonensis TaxID=748120 RepID=A0A3E0H0B1_9GAMM|nr:TMEM165/GDT1 family protein [Paraperlucidibaca baekdonensis]REH35851.1 putative Ca2+/H+ antiporter (TMEM165/GDT1 family) [Paraperlucidibaca baekdonensis]